MNTYFFFFFAFYAETQDGRQQWWVNDCWGKSPANSADRLQVKYFVEIALSCTVSETNAFLRFTQKWPPKLAGK